MAGFNSTRYNVHMVLWGLSHSPPVGHDPDDTASSGDLSKLESRISSVSKHLERDTAQPQACHAPFRANPAARFRSNHPNQAWPYPCTSTS